MRFLRGWRVVTRSIVSSILQSACTTAGMRLCLCMLHLRKTHDTISFKPVSVHHA